MAANANDGVAQEERTNLFISGLELNVTDTQLSEAFSKVGPLSSVCVCRGRTSQRSLGYGFVNYLTPQDASRALNELNFMKLNGKSIRLKYALSNPKSTSEVFIKNLDDSIDNKALQETFSDFGQVKSCKVAVVDSGESKGFGFVKYQTEEEAQKIIDQMNAKAAKGRHVYVGDFAIKLPENHHPPSGETSKFNRVYVKNLSASITDEKFNEVFGAFGLITNYVIMRDSEGNSKGFGFVTFENSDDAARAVEALDGKSFDDMNGKWNVTKAKDKWNWWNLYVSNLDESVTDDKLRELFHTFGTIKSHKVVREASGVSGGYGFVEFSNPREASNAITGMNGKMFGTKPLYVAIAEGKEQRKARLLQMNPVYPMYTPVVVYPMYTPAIGVSMPQMLGAILYPRVEQLEPDIAAQVTGMLLEQDQTDVIHLLESPDALKEKVAEAKDLISNHLASMSLGDNIEP